MDELSVTADSSARRYLRLCPGSHWSPFALDEASASSATTDFAWAALVVLLWPGQAEVSEQPVSSSRSCAKSRVVLFSIELPEAIHERNH